MRHAGRRLEPLDDAADEGGTRRMGEIGAGGWVVRLWQPCSRGHHQPRIDPGPDVGDIVEAAHEQPRPCKEQDCDGNLRDNEPATQEACAAAAGHTPT